MNKENRKIYQFIFIYLIFTIILTICAFIYAILLKNKVLSTNTSSFNKITFILGILLFFVLGLLSGITAKKNGLIEGLLSALIIISIVLLLNLILKVNIESKFFIKGASYLLSSMAGGIIGVNKTIKKL